MSSIHQLLMPSKILYGQGSFSEVGREAFLLGTKVLIISDPIMEKVGHIALCEQHMREAAIPFSTYTGVNSEPTDIYVQEALSVCKEENCDVIIAVGGGSCIDTAKAVAVMMTNDGYIGDYVGGRMKFTQQPLPLIAVPTTAGTGSEVTKVTVIIDTAHDVKMMISQPELLPRIAIVDPLLTLSCPPAVTAATGLDALCHAIEAYLSRHSQLVTDTMALSAIELIVNNLPTTYQNGGDVAAREKVAMGAMLAGVAFSNASVTLVHGMSRPIGALFHVPHGVSNAMLLPAVLEFTANCAIDKLAAIGRIMKPSLRESSHEDLANMVINEIKKLCTLLNIPNLKGWGIDREKFTQAIPKMAADALASGSPDNNPKIPTYKQIEQLYQHCYDYQYQI